MKIHIVIFYMGTKVSEGHLRSEDGGWAFLRNIAATYQTTTRWHNPKDHTMNYVQILPIVYVAPSIWNVALLHFLNSFPATAWRLGTVIVPLVLVPVVSLVRSVAPPGNSCSEGVAEADDDDGFSITWLSFRWLLDSIFIGVFNHCVSHHTLNQNTRRSCRSEFKIPFTLTKKAILFHLLLPAMTGMC
jgi:hypothetical protein